MTDVCVQKVILLVLMETKVPSKKLCADAHLFSLKKNLNRQDRKRNKLNPGKIVLNICIKYYSLFLVSV